MHLFESILLLLAGAVGLAALARRFGVPYPALLALAGAALTFVPFGPTFTLDPELALALFVAPVLLDAAFDASIRDLKANWWPVVGLVFVAVGLTTALVATVAHFLVPSLPWSAAIALGAIVAPPDAAAATAVLRHVHLPQRIVVVLEGESLLNDASALIVYRLAVSATLAGGGVIAQTIAPVFLLSIVGSVIAGLLLAYLMRFVSRGIEDIPSAIVLQFITTFGIWILAERLNMSPVLTVVVFASVTARFSAKESRARLRTPSYAVWETVVMVLNALAFVLVGLQLRPVLAAAPEELGSWLKFAGAILFTVIAVRFAWVMTTHRWSTPRELHSGAEHTAPPSPPWKSRLVVSWCGMRGIVSLATALALPENFPHRPLLLFTALTVTLGTLVLQGMTLRRLLLKLALPDDGVIDSELRLARVEIAQAAIASLENESAVEAAHLRRDLEQQRDAAHAALEGDGRAHSVKKELLRLSVATRRARLLELRNSGAIGDNAFHRLEEELDVVELAAS